MKIRPIFIIFFILFAIGLPKSNSLSDHDPNLIRTFDEGNFVFNNISVDMENNGMLVSHRITGHAGMEWPNGTNKLIDFASGIWFAGTVEGDIRTAVAEYGPEFVPGTFGSDPMDTVHKIYYVSTWDLDDPFNSPDVINWPWTEGAPWIDNNNDGVYDVNDGDLPDMHGDIMIWYVMNDGDVETHSNIFGTQPLNLEVSILQWGNDNPEQNDMVFTKVVFRNHGDQNIEDMYFSIWDDPDLGDAGDDFVGCDTTLQLGYCYNDGFDNDYGTYPPAIGRVLLQGPMVESVGDTAYAFGTNFPGFRNLPMTSFVKYINGDNIYTDPNDATEVYNYMSGYQRDGSPFIDSSTGLPTHFVHPCDPNENTGGNDDCWVDSDDHASGDRRFLLSSGPFSMAMEDEQEIMFATVISEGTDALNSVTELMQYALNAMQFYESEYAEVVFGCTDPEAINYNPDASVDDGSCIYSMLGDLNQDNQLNVLDIVRMVNIIMGATPSEYELWAGDMNEDDSINVLDIVIIVNCIITDCWFGDTVTDIDGNIYNTVVIGDQEWMAENLKVTHYRNGDEIPTGYFNSDWVNLTSGGYAVYNNDPVNIEIYGNLYNYYAVDDDRDVCPEDWHVPTDEEWIDLEMALGMSYEEAHETNWRGTNEGSKLAGNTNLWNSGELELDPEFNTVGFIALPAGDRYFYNGSYYDMGSIGNFWSSTQSSSNFAWARGLNYDHSEVNRGYASKRNGISVRCVRD